MAQKSWQLNRRDVLKGGGLALGLPLLKSMAWADPPRGGEVPKRLVATYIAYGVYEPVGVNGAHHEWSWWPCRDAGPLTFNRSTAPFEPLREYVSYLRGLDHAGGYALGGHSSGDVFATGAFLAGNERTNNISIDQFAARANGHHTRYPSLVLGTEGGTGSYGSAKTLSHYGPGRPIPSMNRPQDIFNRLFNPYGDHSVDQIRSQLRRDASVLDLLMENSQSVHSQLGVDDRRTMDEYLDSVRAIERRVERTDRWTHQPLPRVDARALNLEASPRAAQDYIRCMYDLLFLALRTDSTRFATLMLESEHSQSSELWNYATYVLGYNGATHDIAHRRPIESGHWDLWRAQQHAYFLTRLRDTVEGEGNMLDRTLVLWGSAHPHESHSARNYPIQLAGGNALGFRHGRLHDFSGRRKVPLANLFVSMLNAVDAPTERFADSTGPMTDLRG